MSFMKHILSMINLNSILKNENYNFQLSCYHIKKKSFIILFKLNERPKITSNFLNNFQHLCNSNNLVRKKILDAH